MIKLLIGGSPCTYWSICQKNGRETTAEGMGWELFKNYLIAREKFKPDFFLYENNKSADEAIKMQIRHEFGVTDPFQPDFFTPETGVRYIEINSALVSAQHRERFYVHNCGEVEQPKNRHLCVADVLLESDYRDYTGGEFVRLKQNLKSKSNCPHIVGKTNEQCSIGCRVYDVLGKAKTLMAKGGGGGAKLGLYLIDGKVKVPTRNAAEKLQTLPVGYTRSVSAERAATAVGNGWTAEVIIHILSHALDKVPRDEEIVVLSMYDGIATGRYVLDKMGFSNVRYYAYEIDKYAIQVALSNYPDIIECGDAFQLRDENWRLPE